MAVHLFGIPADVAGLMTVAEHAAVPLVEDAAQAHGARLDGRRAGSLGRIASFSFYPTKNLGAVGDAGAVTTSDPELSRTVGLLREYGWHTREDAETFGVNARLDELQAAFLRVALGRLEAETDRRRSAATFYLQALDGVPGLDLPGETAGSEPAWHQFVVHHARRDELAAALARQGIGTAVHYAVPPPRQSAFRELVGGRRYPVAERHAATALSLPMHAGISAGDQERVVAAVESAARGL